jgi:NADH-quinone oxidoreductase subunit F
MLFYRIGEIYSTRRERSMAEQMRIVTRDIDVPGIDTLAVYQAHGGYQSLRKALALEPAAIIEEIKTSQLRGRGGAGFPAGMKWSFLAKGSPKPTYLCCNADESEPGTFKDRMLMERLPHRVIEGILISSYATGTKQAFIYIRGELAYAARQLERAVEEARAAQLVGKNILGTGVDIEVVVHRGAGAYICGEETALLESLEGKRGYPRLKPPFPAAAGLYGGPTVINNCETLTTIPMIIEMGGAKYAEIGTEKSKGTRIYCVSGQVNKPGNYELPLGIPLRTIIEEYAGGVLNGKQAKAIIPGGSSMPMLPASKLDIPMDYESVAAAGSQLGAAGVIVISEEACIVGAVLRMTEFYRDESCGKCTPCREGTFWLVQLLERLEAGHGHAEDIPLLLDICDNISGKSFCPLGDAATGPIVSSIKNFRDEYIYHAEHHCCMVGPKAHQPVAAH